MYTEPICLFFLLFVYLLISWFSGQEVSDVKNKVPKTQLPPVQKELAGLVNRFAQDTSLHGFASLCNKRETLNPFKWKNCLFMFAILGSMTFLGINLYYLFQDYTRYPVTTSIMTERRDILELPAVTFCLHHIPHVIVSYSHIYTVCFQISSDQNIGYYLE